VESIVKKINEKGTVIYISHSDNGHEEKPNRYEITVYPSTGRKYSSFFDHELSPNEIIGRLELLVEDLLCTDEYYSASLIDVYIKRHDLDWKL